MLKSMNKHEFEHASGNFLRNLALQCGLVSFLSYLVRVVSLLNPTSIRPIGESPPSRHSNVGELSNSLTILSYVFFESVFTCVSSLSRIQCFLFGFILNVKRHPLLV
jgi:hypothetical protein